MISIQVQLTDDQAQRLKELAAQDARSMADLIRESVDALLRDRAARSRTETAERALAVIGAFESGVGDLAREHDRYLA